MFAPELQRLWEISQENDKTLLLMVEGLARELAAVRAELWAATSGMPAPPIDEDRVLGIVPAAALPRVKTQEAGQP